MAYIGKQPTVGNFVKLDAITTSATTTFNLTNGGVAYSPQSPNHCIVSLNGVIQSPTTSFTISGSTIVFASALTSSDVIDFILVLGDVLNIGTPSDNTVTASKIADGVIGLGKLSATGTKDSTTFLRGDNTFAVPPAGALVYLGATGSQSAQSTIDLNGYFTSSYNYYKIFIDGLYASTNNTEIRMRVATTGSYTVQTTNYYSNIWEAISDGTTNSSNISNSTSFEIARSMSSSVSGNSSIEFTLYNPLGTTGRKTYTGNAAVGSDSANVRNCTIGGFWNSTTAITGLRWFPVSGTMSLDNIRIYGVKNS